MVKRYITTNVNANACSLVSHFISRPSYTSFGVKVKIRNRWEDPHFGLLLIWGSYKWLLYTCPTCSLFNKHNCLLVTYICKSIWFYIKQRISFANVAATKHESKKQQPQMYRPLHTNRNSTFVIVMICVPTSLQSMSVASPEGWGISGCLCCETRRRRRHGSWLKSPWEISEGVRSWWGKLKQSGQSKKGENHRISSQTERYELMMWKSIKEGFLLQQCEILW